jgi:hypothetical protein
MHLNTGSLWQNEEQIELSDAELQMVQGGHGATHKSTYGGYDCGGNYAYNSSDCGNYGGAYLNYNDGSSCDGSQGTFVIMQVLPASSCSNSCYNTCG